MHLKNGQATIDRVGKYRYLPPPPNPTSPLEILTLTKYFYFNSLP